MITIISGTNRNEANTLNVAKIVAKRLDKLSVKNQICDLNKLPRDLFVPEHYWNTPESFTPFQEMISNCDGIIVVTPEYNGGFPGVLKYFIDLLKFPESLVGIPSTFIGVAAGVFGALRPIEQLEMVFQYRNAHIYGPRTLFPKVEEKLNEAKDDIIDEFTNNLLNEQLQGFSNFVKKLKD